MAKVIYTYEEVKELLNKKDFREIKFDISNLNTSTSKIDFIGFGIRIKLELIHVNNKFSFKYSEENQLILQLNNVDEMIIDTQIVQPFKDLLYILKSNTSEYNNYIFLVVPVVVKQNGNTMIQRN